MILDFNFSRQKFLNLEISWLNDLWSSMSNDQWSLRALLSFANLLPIISLHQFFWPIFLTHVFLSRPLIIIINFFLFFWPIFLIRAFFSGHNPPRSGRIEKVESKLQRSDRPRVRPTRSNTHTSDQSKDGSHSYHAQHCLTRSWKHQSANYTTRR